MKYLKNIKSLFTPKYLSKKDIEDLLIDIEHYGFSYKIHTDSWKYPMISVYNDTILPPNKWEEVSKYIIDFQRSLSRRGIETIFYKQNLKKMVIEQGKGDDSSLFLTYSSMYPYLTAFFITIKSKII